MPAWVIWAVVAVLLALGEIFTPGLFFLGPIALAALASTVVASALAGARALRPVRRPRAAAARPARAGRLVPAAARDHRGQPRGQHRLGHLLPGHRREGGDLRDRELHPGDRAAHRHDAP